MTRMVGKWITSAPNSVSAAPNSLACARARVTTTLRPKSGRSSYQASDSRSDTTSPTTVIAGEVIPASSTRDGSDSSVPTMVRCLG